MPLSAPVPRKTSHIRRVTYQGYEREDGLWDMEAELHDSKAHDMPSFRHQGVRLAGDPIRRMWLRVTIDRQLVVHAIEAAMDAHPLQDCPQARPALQGMVGACMARGWRQAIAQHMGGVASCTHLREVLFNLATAAFQTLPAAFGGGDPDTPPRHLGQCTGWDFEGNGVKEYFPQFYGRGEANTQPSTPHNPTGKKSF